MVKVKSPVEIEKSTSNRFKMKRPSKSFDQSTIVMIQKEPKSPGKKKKKSVKRKTKAVGTIQAAMEPKLFPKSKEYKPVKAGGQKNHLKYLNQNITD